MNLHGKAARPADSNASIAHTTLPAVWMKAAVLGANWAASEIILGSFLHNLHVPFKGSRLTAIGLVLLIAAAHRWKDSGIFWRAGLVCALMKTMSPSAVIFGPMVAIFMEALLFGAAVRLLGRNFLGFLTGSTLAMTWILAQKIFNYVLYYGFSIVGIYSDLVVYAERQLRLGTPLFWLPLFLLLSVYLLAGLLATIAGMRIGQKSEGFSIPPEWQEPIKREWSKEAPQRSFPYSLGWLLFSFLALIGTLVLINNSPLWIWVPLTTLLVAVWVRRYRRGLRQITRPRFWIFFLLLTTLSALLISGLDHKGGTWLDGLLIGLQMNFRAAAVVTGFAVLGTELYNPRIREYLSRTMFRQLPVAMELAFDSLPGIIAKLPAASWFLRRPFDIVRMLIHDADTRIQQLSQPAQGVVLVTGEAGQGKTTFLLQLFTILRKEGIKTQGLVLKRILDGNQVQGYDLLLLGSERSLPFLRVATEGQTADIGRFRIATEGLETGLEHLRSTPCRNAEILIMDEIGRLEMRGGGWDPVLQQFPMTGGPLLVASVRDTFLEEITSHYSLSPSYIVNAGKEDPGPLAMKLAQWCRNEEAG
ncbi:MAG TPA: nucleoside-triphosphatase [Bacteroidales bacterium]|nr:nucleoside-triphosphatase [Bacteroidales bacterium]